MLLDRVYGTITIAAPLILDIVKSPTFQRLKGIDQAGYAKPYFPGTEHTRFEHSLGVYELLRRYNAPLEEQISGLIHDVSHTAFSHCIDYVLAKKAEEQIHQDNIFEEFVRKSEIPAILKKSYIDVEYILNDKNFPLKETKLPDICADRIDYSLRTARAYNELTKKETKNILKGLQVHNQQWVFQDVSSAREYAELFKRMNDRYYAGFPSAVMFRTVGDYLRHALQQGYVTSSDFFTTDHEVLQKIKPRHRADKVLRMLWQRMNRKAKPARNRNEADAAVKCKSRVIDPLCWDRGVMQRLSEVEHGWKAIVERESLPKEHFIRFDADGYRQLSHNLSH